MMFQTHRIFIILISLLIVKYSSLFNYFNVPHNLFSLTFLIFVLIAIFASMIPDIDNPSSKLGKNIKIFGYVFKHRGFFHSLPALVIFTFLVSKFTTISYTFAFFLGYLSHLLLDNLTYQGIYWFYPLKYRIKGFTKSKSLFEKILFYCCILIVLWLLLSFI